MSKIAEYLREHLTGEVLTSAVARRYFSVDGSILSITPSVIIYPQNENDVRKTARFTWQLAERGRNIPITARGMGTDQAGAAIGSGIIMVFPAHMNKILELDSKSGMAAVEPGINYAKLQQALHTHGRFLPPFPSSIEFSTIGGAVANNASGEKTIKYGDTRNHVSELRVVLANGEVIVTKRLSKREFSKKMGLATYEGEIYRALDVLLEENQEIIKNSRLSVTKNSAGYDLADIKHKDGSFDLTPLIVGSQGTLGIVTEVVLETKLYNPKTALFAVFFDDLRIAQEVVLEISRMPETPSALEMVDTGVLKFIQQHHPNQLKGLVEEPLPALVLLVELDDLERQQKRVVKKIEKILEHYQIKYKIATDEETKERLWKIRHAAALIVAHHEGAATAIPFIEDGVVPSDRFQEYLESVQELFKKHHVESAMWGHAGNNNLHIQPFLDLSQTGDRQKVFRLSDEYYKLVIGLGGSTSGEHGDGRMRAPYLPELYGEQIYGLFQKVKRIFDPYDTLNPGVKLNIDKDSLVPMLRSEFSTNRIFDHLPPG